MKLAEELQSLGYKDLPSRIISDLTEALRKAASNGQTCCVLHRGSFLHEDKSYHQEVLAWLSHQGLRAQILRSQDTDNGRRVDLSVSW